MLRGKGQLSKQGAHISIELYPLFLTLSRWERSLKPWISWGHSLSRSKLSIPSSFPIASAHIICNHKLYSRIKPTNPNQSRNKSINKLVEQAERNSQELTSDTPTGFTRDAGSVTLNSKCCRKGKFFHKWTPKKSGKPKIQNFQTRKRGRWAKESDPERVLRVSRVLPVSIHDRLTTSRQTLEAFYRQFLHSLNNLGFWTEKCTEFEPGARDRRGRGWGGRQGPSGWWSEHCRRAKPMAVIQMTASAAAAVAAAVIEGKGRKATVGVAAAAAGRRRARGRTQMPTAWRRIEPKGCRTPASTTGCRTPASMKVCRTPESRKACRTPESMRGCRTPASRRGCRTPASRRGSRTLVWTKGSRTSFVCAASPVGLSVGGLARFLGLWTESGSLPRFGDWIWSPQVRGRVDWRVGG